MEDTNQTNTNGPVAAGGTGTGETPTATPVAAVPTPEPTPIATPTPVPTPAPEVIAVSTPVEPVAVVNEVVATAPVTAADVVAAVPAAPVVNMRKAVIKQYTIAAGIVVVIVVCLVYVLEQQGRIQTHLFDKVTALVMPVPSAAVVNGVKISMADYEKNKMQIEQSAVQGGGDPKDPTTADQIKKQALDVLINTELLRQEATKAGVTVTQAQVDARYAEIVKSLQGEDKLQARMKELNITKESLLKDISAEILIQTYLAKAVDTSSIKIEQSDIKAAYDKANTNPDSKLPPLEQVSSAIEAQLKQTKEQDMINAYIQKVRDGAKIETKI